MTIWWIGSASRPHGRGRWSEGAWQAGALPPGDYTLRITARDYSGNEAQGRRELKLRLP